MLQKYYPQKFNTDDEKVDIHLTGFCERITDKVCIRCGECHNGYKIMIDNHEKIKQEKKERKELAAKLWEDGCNGD